MLKIINILAIAADLIWFGALQTEISLNIQVILIHTTAVLCSILYHMFPALRKKSYFRFLAHTFAIMMLMLIIVNVYSLLSATNGMVRSILLIVLILITAPGTIVNVPLLLLLNYDTCIVKLCSKKNESFKYQRAVSIPEYNQEYIKWLSSSPK